jgi:hypothetical protein
MGYTALDQKTSGKNLPLAIIFTYLIKTKFSFSYNIYYSQCVTILTEVGTDFALSYVRRARFVNPTHCCKI